jgi:hypothetical protein
VLFARLSRGPFPPAIQQGLFGKTGTNLLDRLEAVPDILKQLKVIPPATNVEFETGE